VIGSVIRFVLGAIFGAAIGFWMVVEINEPILFFGGMALSTMVFGWLAMRHGRALLEAVHDYYHWPFGRN
jgi:hypothetical protein